MRHSANTEAVVLVPGLWLGGWSMAFIGRGLCRAAFRTHAFSYATVRAPLRESAFALRAFSDALPGETVHFVGHSLGGIVIRAMLAYCPPPRGGRVVTLGSPHGGCRVAQALTARAVCWHRLIGRSIADLLRGELSSAGLAGREVGVIKGDVPWGLGRLFVRLPGANDGVVCTAEGDLAGAVDTITLPVAHSGMLVSRAVTRQTRAFLRHGRFEHGVHDPSPGAGRPPP
jgi:pimeloyl-ACP methyl ester carboxylesterase